MKTPELTAILIDDEPMGLNAMERMIQQHCSDIKIVGKTKSPEEAVELVTNLKPDLLFLDIHSVYPILIGFKWQTTSL